MKKLATVKKKMGHFLNYTKPVFNKEIRSNR